MVKTPPSAKKRSASARPAPRRAATARTPPKSLGEDLQKMSHLLQALILSEPSLEKKIALREQHAEVSLITAQLVDKNVKAATTLYKKSTEAVQKANLAIQDALQAIEKVAETIDMIAQAVEMLGKLAAAAP